MDISSNRAPVRVQRLKLVESWAVRSSVCIGVPFPSATVLAYSWSAWQTRVIMVNSLVLLKVQVTVSPAWRLMFPGVLSPSSQVELVNSQPGRSDSLTE